MPLWHEWFQARLRLATLILAALAAAAPHQSAEERESAADDVERLMADGARVIDFYAPYDGSHGPEYRMWVARRTAEHLRWRWLAQVDPPSADELVAAWRAAEETAVAYASVPSSPRPGCGWPGCCARSATPPARGPSPTRRGEAAHALGARPACSTSSPPRGPRPRPPRAPRRRTLTPREAEILALVAEGRTNGEIGKQLFISTKTVSVHVSNILGQARGRVAHRGRRGGPSPRPALRRGRAERLSALPAGRWVPVRPPAAQEPPMHAAVA